MKTVFAMHAAFIKKPLIVISFIFDVGGNTWAGGTGGSDTAGKVFGISIRQVHT
jgi:hypothetical protein